MASRRLALNLNQALRSRAALKAIQPYKRGFATPIHQQQINTESTTLTNGLTVCVRTQSSILETELQTDRNRALAMGADLNSRCLDRCWQQSRDRCDQWHKPSEQADIEGRERQTDRKHSLSSKSKTWAVI